jgi:hypothetical protein
LAAFNRSLLQKRAAAVRWGRGGSAHRERLRIGLPGEPRSPIDPVPHICPLYGRRGRATEKCRTVAPVLREIASTRFAACHYLIADPVDKPQPLAAIA